MLRCRFMLFGIEVHSYEQNAVNFPGSFAFCASAMFSFHTVAATSGDINDLTGSLPIMLFNTYKKTLLRASTESFSRISGFAAGSLLIGELGSFAIFVTPTYSEWSVTPAQSSGVSILMSYPSGCLIASPLKYLYESPGSVTVFPASQASNDQLVCTCVSPKKASRSGLDDGPAAAAHADDTTSNQAKQFRCNVILFP